MKKTNIIKNSAAVMLLVFLFIFFAFAGCSAGDSETFSGKEADLSGVWVLDDEFNSSGIRIPDTLEFFSDGTVQSDWGGTYTVDGSRLNISYSAMDSYSYTFSLNGDELILTSSDKYSSDATEYRYLRNQAQSGNTSSLAASCDEILAEGTNDNGVTYQLVLNYADNVNENEKIGVIKNNEWLIEPSEDCPTISNVSLLPHSYAFVLDNCFFINDENEKIWNVETNEYYELNNGWDYFLISYFEYYTAFESNIKYIEKGNKVLIARKSTEQNIYEVLNTDNMQIEQRLTTELHLSPLSDGLIYGYDYNGTSAFFDESLSKIIDISKLNRPTEDTAVFIDGVCTLRLYEDKYYNYKIDKNGNILSKDLLS